MRLKKRHIKEIISLLLIFLYVKTIILMNDSFYMSTYTLLFLFIFCFLFNDTYKIYVTIIALFTIISIFAYFYNIKINTTESVQLGFYRIVQASLEKNAYILFCPPPNHVFEIAKQRSYIAKGYCSGDYRPLIKQVVAMRDDIISISPQGVYVNGHFVKNSRPMLIDQQGKKLPQMHLDNYKLKAGELLLMGTNSPYSFDGRYFGPLKNIRYFNILKPIFTW